MTIRCIAPIGMVEYWNVEKMGPGLLPAILVFYSFPALVFKLNYSMDNRSLSICPATAPIFY